MEMNSKRPSGNIASSRWQKRSKSIGDEPRVMVLDYEKIGDRDAIVKRPKVNSHGAIRD